MGEAVIAIVALMFVLFLALGAYVTVKVVGAAKRGVDRTVAQARRSVEDTTLKARTFVQPGAAGELAQLRLKLRTSMRATQDALHARVAEDASLKESLDLFGRLSVHGRELDDDLKRLETEPDKVQLAELLPDLRKRTEQITASADSLRRAARDRAHRIADDDLDSLSAQIDIEAGALRHWTTEPSPQPAQTPPSWPEASAPERPAAHQTWPGTPQGGPAEAPDRPALSPTEPRPAYPWQKKARPESTT
ncbi:hypothetical protein AB0M68_30640 [Streptomyces sp. NPDC051453]|uniref:hypothetical protein n=1 Tax=unclassified Streptomyces TaxID=2593676 RepID=UPI0030871776|nr:hypothetical protein OG518_17460 [Streptomyces sp. NBC_01397]